MPKKQQKFQHLTFVTIAKVPPIYGISRATIYRWIKSGKLPQPIRHTVRTVGWKRSVLDEIFLRETSQ